MGIIADKREIKDATLIQRRTALIESNVQEEIICLDLEGSQYIGFNGTASLIWSKIEFPVRFKDLLNIITAKFAVDYSQAKTDAIHFLEKLYDKKLITLK